MGSIPTPGTKPLSDERFFYAYISLRLIARICNYKYLKIRYIYVGGLQIRVIDWWEEVSVILIQLYAMKYLIKCLAIIFVVLFVTATVCQIKAENYKNDLIKEYNFFSNRERISYKPVVIFYIESKLFGRHQNSWADSNEAYYEYGVIKNKESGNTYTLIANIEYNAYLRYCYYK